MVRKLIQVMYAYLQSMITTHKNNLQHALEIDSSTQMDPVK